MPDTGVGERHGDWSRLLWLSVTVLIVGLDQWTKGLASVQLEYGRPLPILPVLNFTLHHNTGAAFSFLSSESGWQRWFFSAVAAVVSVVLFLWLSRLGRNQRLLALSLALILGGALGNLLDRLILGYVVDFVSVHYAGSYFPTFNVADSAISVGAAMMILDTILQARGEEKER